MTEDEIRQLIRLCERKLKRQLVALPLGAWGVALLCAPAILLGIWIELGFVEAVFVFFGGLTSLHARDELRCFEKNRAQRIWKFLSQNGQLLTNQRATPSTKRLFASIAQLYFHDPQGEILPLPQAIRLLDTHHKQQQRLMNLDARLADLGVTRARLQENLSRLHALGERSESGEQNLREFFVDEANLRELKRGVEASCARLELLLPGVERALQVRLLHREVSQLSGARSQNQMALEANDSDEIARQITREIETYLKLERESEAHFR